MLSALAGSNLSLDSGDADASRTSGARNDFLFGPSPGETVPGAAADPRLHDFAVPIARHVRAATQAKETAGFLTIGESEGVSFDNARAAAASTDAEIGREAGDDGKFVAAESHDAVARLPEIGNVQQEPEISNDSALETPGGFNNAGDDQNIIREVSQDDIRELMDKLASVRKAHALLTQELEPHIQGSADAENGVGPPEPEADRDTSYPEFLQPRSQMMQLPSQMQGSANAENGVGPPEPEADRDTSYPEFMQPRSQMIELPSQMQGLSNAEKDVGMPFVDHGSRGHEFLQPRPQLPGLASWDRGQDLPVLAKPEQDHDDMRSNLQHARPAILISRDSNHDFLQGPKVYTIVSQMDVDGPEAATHRAVARATGDEFFRASPPQESTSERDPASNEDMDIKGIMAQLSNRHAQAGVGATRSGDDATRVLKVQEAGLHLDLSVLKPLKTAVLVTGGLCSKMFGLGIMGYLAYQSVQANFSKPPQQQEPKNCYNQQAQ